MPKVQIVIPAINLWKKYTKPCIDSIKTKYPHRILLIDNASSDETLVEAGILVSDTFAHHRNEERWGCSQSWNFGIKDAFDRGYDYVLVLNNDVLLHPEAIDRMVERMEASKTRFVDIDTKRTVLAYADDGSQKNINLESNILAMVTCLDVTGECIEPPAVFDLKPDNKKEVPESEHPCFSGYMINKQCWETVGQFDENFRPAYYEDNDYHYRINLAGMKAIVLPTSMFYHYGSRTNMEAYDKPFIDSSSNHRYFIRKWGGNPGHEKFTTPFNNGNTNAPLI